jgi:hypothetical protein
METDLYHFNGIYFEVASANGHASLQLNLNTYAVDVQPSYKRISIKGIIIIASRQVLLCHTRLI